MEIEKKLPPLGDVLDKFKHLNIDVKDLISLIEYSQGRDIKDVFIWIKISHTFLFHGLSAISFGESEADVDKHLDARRKLDMFGKESLRTMERIINHSDNYRVDLEKFMSKIGWEEFPKFYRHNPMTDTEGVCFKKKRD